MKQIIIKDIDPSTKITLALDKKLGDGIIEETFQTTAGFLAAAECGTCSVEDGMVSFGQPSVFSHIKAQILELEKGLTKLPLSAFCATSHKLGVALVSADEKSRVAHESSRLANLWLEHPAKAHADHEAAAAAHDNEAGTARYPSDCERHKRLAKEHRRAAQFWAGKETQTLNRLPGGN